MALKRLIAFLQDKHVLVRTDNMSAVYHINHQGGTRSLRCLQESRRLLFWAHPRLASIRAIYIPVVVNRAADLLSRTGPPPGEWRLHPEVVGLIWDRFGRAHTDLFASAIESVITYCISMWYASSSAADKKALQWVINSAQKIIGCPLPSLKELYTVRCLGRAANILKDPFHPGHHLFELLPSGKRFRSIKSRTNRLKNSFYPSTIRELNTVSIHTYTHTHTQHKHIINEKCTNLMGHLIPQPT